MTAVRRVTSDSGFQFLVFSFQIKLSFEFAESARISCAPIHHGGSKIEDKRIFDDTQDDAEQDSGWLLLKTENSKLKTV
jgi:hypothetical protein